MKSRLSRVGLVLKLALLAGTTLVSLYAVEAALRAIRVDPGFALIDAAERQGRPFDARSRTEVVRELRRTGVDAVPRTIPAMLLERGPDGRYRSRVRVEGAELLPLAGISKTTTVLCNETGEYVIYESDAHGFRNPPGPWDGEPVDAVLIGDSFTVGECAARSIADLLRTDFPRTANLGMGGNGPLFELATLTEYGPALRPRVVFWVYFENDLWWFDLGIERQTPLLMSYLDPGFRQHLVTLQPEIDASLRAALHLSLAEPGDVGPVARRRALHLGPFQVLFRFMMLKRLRSEVGDLVHSPKSPADREPPDFTLFEQVLTRARDRSASWGGELIFVYLPGVWNFERGVIRAWAQSNQTRARVLNLADSLGLHLIDVEDAMGRHEDPLSLYAYRGTSAIGSPHLNVNGYAFVASLLRKGQRR